MASKMRIEFDGFDEVIARLAALDGDIKKTTEKALKDTHSIITGQAEAAIAPHKSTGRTQRSLVRNAQIQWAGTVASVTVGFDISNGGLPSIFLMYGTPRMRKDQKLYNAFYSKKTLNTVMQAQEDAFYDEIRRLSDG